MSFIRNFIGNELIDIVEWLDETPDTMVWRFDRPRNEIKNGAQLIVRPSQVAVFVDQGHIADVFQPGRYKLHGRPAAVPAPGRCLPRERRARRR